MASDVPETLTAVAEAGWRWVLDQVEYDDGPWIPESAPDDGPPAKPELWTGMHSGIGGLAHALAEIRLVREWTVEESDLAAAICARLRDEVEASMAADYFDGLVSDIGVFIALDVDGADDAVKRLLTLAEPDGWPQSFLQLPRFVPGARLNDATLGTASVVLGALWADRAGVADARDLAERAADVLLGEAEEESTGLNWRFVPVRFRTDPPTDMPNWSHGLAGIAASLALAGVDLDRPDLVEAARRGAEHLVSLGYTQGGGLVVPHMIPPPDPAAWDEDPIKYGWCHGPTGTSLLFPALERAGVTEVAGESPRSWQRRCLRSVRQSGLPERLRPGFWDNDGRCCGTAGVGDAFLTTWQRYGDDADLAFALRLADVLVERAHRNGPHAWWRFLEHRNPEPLLPPGVGWMQGAAGISAFLFRAARVAAAGRDAPAVARMDNWWALPAA